VLVLSVLVIAVLAVLEAVLFNLANNWQQKIVLPEILVYAVSF